MIASQTCFETNINCIMQAKAGTQDGRAAYIFQYCISTQNMMEGKQNYNNQMEQLAYLIEEKVDDEQGSDFSIEAMQQAARMKNRMKRRRRMKNKFKVGVWSQEEDILYMQFLKQNISLIKVSKSQRQAVKTNILASQFIKSRSPEQCRTHLQKLIKDYATLEGVIAKISQIKQKRIFQQAKQRLIYYQQQKDMHENIWWDGQEI